MPRSHFVCISSQQQYCKRISATAARLNSSDDSESAANAEPNDDADAEYDNESAGRESPRRASAAAGAAGRPTSLSSDDEASRGAQRLGLVGPSPGASAPGDTPGSAAGDNAAGNRPGELVNFSLLNIRGLLFETRPSKVPYVASLLSDPSQVAFALTETWLTPDHEEAEITVPGFAPFRADRKQRAKAKRGSGGVALYLRDNLAITAEKVFEYSCGVIEAVGVHIPTLNLRIFVVYRPGDRRPDPSSTAVNARNRGEFRSTAKELKAFLRKLEENLSTMPAPTPDVMLMGDINLPHADWKSGECKAGATDDEQTMVKDLYEFALSHFMVQQIEGSTHEAGKLLDLIFTNNHQLVHDFSSTPSTVSDHYVVEVSAHYKSNTCELENESENQDPDQPPTLRDYNFFHEDAKWPEMKAAMDECNWEDEFRDLEATEMLDKFVNFITSLAAKYVPLRKKPSAKSDKIPRDRRILMLKRTRAKKQLKTATGARAEALNLRLISIELELQKSYRQQSNREETKAISNIKRNPKSFYSYANKFSKVSTAIGPLINSAKKLVTSASQMAKYFRNSISRCLVSQNTRTLMQTIFSLTRRAKTYSPISKQMIKILKMPLMSYRQPLPLVPMVYQPYFSSIVRNVYRSPLR